LVRDLFAIYKTRIWMEVVSYSFRPSETAARALATGIQSQSIMPPSLYGSYSTPSAPPVLPPQLPSSGQGGGVNMGPALSGASRFSLISFRPPSADLGQPIDHAYQQQKSQQYQQQQYLMRQRQQQERVSRNSHDNQHPDFFDFEGKYWQYPKY
jgi:hypothetical protein